MTSAELSVAFFLQMFFILAACRAVGWVARRCGQPQVVGEMIAGVLIGPSLFGLFWPGAQQFLFPPESMNTLYVFAQLGIGLYMFLVGVEFNTELFRSRMRSAVSVSLAGMLVPFIIGTALALWLVKMPGLFSERTRPFEAILFLGAAIAITAFPVLARIIHDRGLTGTALGTLVLAAGAMNAAAASGRFPAGLEISGRGVVGRRGLLLVGAVVLVAWIVGQGVACWAGARLSGGDNRTAMGVGALMNARGVMELIILNIGLQKGIIEPALFSIMVLMAIVTTLMASPLFEWVYGKRARAAGELDALSSEA